MQASVPSTVLLGRPDAFDTGRVMAWRSLWRSGVTALLIAFVLSTQFLFRVGLYEGWPLPAIVLGWLDYFGEQLLVVGSIFAMAAIAVAVPIHSPAASHAKLLIAIALGALIGEKLILMWHPVPPDVSQASVLGARVARWLTVGGLAYIAFILWRRAGETAARLHQIELQRIQLDRQMAEVQLQSLRAQIEPHFLFNTLANVRSLYPTEPEQGRRLLASYLAYLRAALPQMRCDETTLGCEVDLARAYLNVLQVRMGRRLTVRFDVPDPLTHLPIPPLALSTLTENAIKHGLNPMPQGGTIEVVARVVLGCLKVSVADTGAGVRDSGGAGSGLANLRARLNALYGESAKLSIEANAPCGIRATIAVPLRASALAA